MSLLQEHFGPDVVEHIELLESARAARSGVQVKHAPSRVLGSVDVDVLQVGGGPSVMHAILLALHGVRVAVADRRRLGCAHREWNISAPELLPLHQSGLLTRAQVDAVVVSRYRTGFVQWHGAPRRYVRNVLDHAVDAHAFMSLMRTRAEQSGVQLLDHHAWTSLEVCADGVLATFDHHGAAVEVRARLLLDGTGSSTPFASFDLVCPTVGAVLTDLEEGDGPHQVDPTVGEILVSIDDAEAGRQFIWEGFPASRGEFTAYLFYYAEPGDLGAAPLQELYTRFFRDLPRYKRGPARMLRPTYGFIPGHTRLRPVTVSPMDRVLLVGDAAARQSPLTFCGFGSLVRTFVPVVAAVERALSSAQLARTELERAWRDPPQLGLMGLLTLMMMDRGAFAAHPHAINALLDDAFAALEELGEEMFARFVKDQASVLDVARFLGATAVRRPRVFAEAARNLRVSELKTWLGHAAAGAWNSVSVEQDPR